MAWEFEAKVATIPAQPMSSAMKAEKANVLDSVFTNVWLPCLANQEAGKHSNIKVGNVSGLYHSKITPLGGGAIYW